MVSRDGFAGEDVDGSPCHDALLHSLGQSLFIDDAASGAVHQTHTRLHLLHFLIADHALGIRGQGHVHGDEISFLDDLFQSAHLDIQCLGTLLGNIGVIGNDIHIEGLRPLGHAAADAAQAHHAQGLASELYAHIFLAIPLALLHGLVGHGNIAGHGEHHGHSMLRSGNGVATRGIDDDYALGSSRRDINVIHANACTADDLQLLCLLNDLCRNLGSRAHHQGVKFRDNFQEFLCGNLVLHHYLELLLQELNALWGNAISCQNLHTHLSDSPFYRLYNILFQTNNTISHPLSNVKCSLEKNKVYFHPCF